MKKKLLIGGSLLVAMFGIIGAANQPEATLPQATPATSTTLQTTTQPASITEAEPAEPAAEPAPTPSVTTTSAPTPAPAPTQSSSSSGSYTNVDGNRVQSPTVSSDGSVPDGASARCSDGTYSFSQNRRGTCSHHGGVSEWL